MYCIVCIVLVVNILYCIVCCILYDILYCNFIKGCMFLKLCCMLINSYVVQEFEPCRSMIALFSN